MSSLIKSQIRVIKKEGEGTDLERYNVRLACGLSFTVFSKDRKLSEADHKLIEELVVGDLVWMEFDYVFMKQSASQTFINIKLPFKIARALTGGSNETGHVQSKKGVQQDT